MSLKEWFTGLYHKHTKQAVAPVEVKHEAVIRNYPITDISGVDIHSERFTKTYETVRDVIIKHTSEMYSVKRDPRDDFSSMYGRLRETAYPQGLKPIRARVWAKLPQNKREYIKRTLPSVARA